MRQSLYNDRVALLQYGIREITLRMDDIKRIDPSFVFISENIGDPIKKGWHVPDFVNMLVQEEVKANTESWGYVHSRGLLAARQYVVEEAKQCYEGSLLTVDDVVFTNGLGAAIGNMYAVLPPHARVIGPSPSYPTHASLEGFATGGKRISYACDPYRGWRIDVNDLEEQIKKHPEVTGILVINPNNPTGAVYTKEDLEAVVRIAKMYGLFIIADEIYWRMVYGETPFVPMTSVVDGQVPLIVMRGMSKDIPWPGSRCGWLEFHNTTIDTEFATYVAAIKQRLLLEVCATSLPQWVLPKIYKHPSFGAHVHNNNAVLARNSAIITDMLGSIPGVQCNPVQGAFYMTVIFDEGVLTPTQTLPIAHDGIRSYIESLVAATDMPLDKRFVYYLLGSTGIVVTPATDFFTPHHGFRVTTLEQDETVLRNTYTRLKQAITAYLKS